MSVPDEVAYEVRVDWRGENPVVRVLYDDRVIAKQTIRTVGDALQVGALLTNLSTPRLARELERRSRGGEQPS